MSVAWVPSRPIPNTPLTMVRVFSHAKTAIYVLNEEGYWCRVSFKHVEPFRTLHTPEEFQDRVTNFDVIFEPSTHFEDRTA